MSNRAKIEAIRNDRERHFASVFFDHDEWESQPSTINFKGGSYRPDFFDKRRGVYIEVVGTRQAFAQNRYKYLYMLEVCKSLKLEFRSHNGILLDPYRMSLAKKTFTSAREKFEATGVLPEGKTIAFGLRDLIAPIVIETNYSPATLSGCIGIPPDLVRRIVFNEDGDFFIKTEYVKKLREFYDDYYANTEKYPPKEGFSSSIKSDLCRNVLPPTATPATSPSASQVGGDAA